jgi:hypothetical protein
MRLDLQSARRHDDGWTRWRRIRRCMLGYRESGLVVDHKVPRALPDVVCIDQRRSRLSPSIPPDHRLACCYTLGLTPQIGLRGHISQDIASIFTSRKVTGKAGWLAGKMMRHLPFVLLALTGWRMQLARCEEDASSDDFTRYVLGSSAPGLQRS